MGHHWDQQHEGYGQAFLSEANSPQKVHKWAEVCQQDHPQASDAQLNHKTPSPKTEEFLCQVCHLSLQQKGGTKMGIMQDISLVTTCSHLTLPPIVPN